MFTYEVTANNRTDIGLWLYTDHDVNRVTYLILTTTDCLLRFHGFLVIDLQFTQMQSFVVIWLLFQKHQKTWPNDNSGLYAFVQIHTKQ